MWPGDQQGGGQQYPQQPYGQPQYGQQPQGQWPNQPNQPNQPPPNPYHQQPQWGGPPGGGGPRPPGRNNALVITVSAVCAVLLMAGAVFAAVAVTDDDEPDRAGPAPSATPATVNAAAGPGGEPSPEPTRPTDPATEGDGGGDGGLSGPDNDPSKKVKAVVPGWQPVPRKDRQVAYDVPKSWTVQSEGLLIGFENDDGTPKVLMGGTAVHKKDWCGTDERAATGTKGASGAKSTADAALAAADSWARAAYADEFGGRVRLGRATSFSNKHGVKGSTVTAKVTGTSKAKDECASDGIVRTVAVKAPNGEYAVWIVVADTGVADAVSAGDIETMMDSLRFMKTS